MVVVDLEPLVRPARLALGQTLKLAP